MVRPFDPPYANVFAVRNAPYDQNAPTIALDRWGPSIPGVMPKPYKTMDIRRATEGDECPREFMECGAGVKTRYFSGYAASVGQIGDSFA